MPVRSLSIYRRLEEIKARERIGPRVVEPRASRDKVVFYDSTERKSRALLILLHRGIYGRRYGLAASNRRPSLTATRSIDRSEGLGAGFISFSFNPWQRRLADGEKEERKKRIVRFE